MKLNCLGIFPGHPKPEPLVECHRQAICFVDMAAKRRNAVTLCMREKLIEQGAESRCRSMCGMGIEAGNKPASVFLRLQGGIGDQVAMFAHDNRVGFRQHARHGDAMRRGIKRIAGSLGMVAHGQ